MPPVLKQILARQREARDLVAAVAGAIGEALSIEDADGALLYGAGSVDGVPRVPVRLREANVGWVAGPHASAVASLLGHIVGSEAEKKALGSEVLHLYREINLIYSFSEKLASLLELERVAKLTLDQARQVMIATDGALLVLNEETGALDSIASFGDDLRVVSGLDAGTGIIGAVATSGLGEVIDDVSLDPRRAEAEAGLRSLICAPLKVGERVIGAIALGCTQPLPYTAAELKLLTTLALQTATAIENARLFERTIQAARERERLMALHQEAELARTKLEGELKLAARIQADLFPAELPRVSGYELAARNRPARRCGGDYYDALPIARHHDAECLMLCVADVSGKGLPAALLMSNMQATLRALMGRSTSLGEVAFEAGGLLFACTSPEKYVTAALVELEPVSGHVTFVGAGHLDNLLLRASGDVVHLSSTGPPLALLPPGPVYDEMRHVLERGDTLVLFSDGVTDAQNADGEEFGEARLLEVLRGAPGLPVAQLIDRAFEAIDAFVGGTPQFDDITILVARRL